MHSSLSLHSLPRLRVVSSLAFYALGDNAGLEFESLVLNANPREYLKTSLALAVEAATKS
jgi:hypothetical protein